MERILTFNLPPEAAAAAARTAAIMKIRIRPVEAREYGSPLEKILRGEAETSYEGEAPPESMIVLCDITGERFNRFLNNLRKTDAKIDYKAALTRENVKWTPIELLAEMKNEKEALEITND